MTEGRTHSVKVVYERAGYWRAVCSCGFQGTLAGLPQLADAEADWHRAQVSESASTSGTEAGAS